MAPDPQPGRFRAVIGTTTKAREFPFDTEREARAAANELWRWAKDNHEHGTISLYEQVEDKRWALIKTVTV